MTSTPYGTAGAGSYVWIVDRDGYLSFSSAYFASYGVRPVIKVDKTIFE